MLEQDVLPVILGATDGAYALCRAFSHDYGIRPIVLDEELPPLFLHSGCMMACAVSHVQNERILLRALEEIFYQNSALSLLLIPATAHFLAIAKKEKERLEKMFLMPHLPSQGEEAPLPSAEAVAFLYRSASGDCRIAYAEVCGAAKNGAPVAVIGAPAPQAVEKMLLQKSETLSRGAYLFYVSLREGTPVLAQECAVLHPMMSFIGAVDASLPEWMIGECVLAQELPPVETELCGLFSLFPVRKMLSQVFAHKKAQVYALMRRGFDLSLYTRKGERFSLPLWAIFRARRQAFLGEKDFLKK